MDYQDGCIREKMAVFLTSYQPSNRVSCFLYSQEFAYKLPALLTGAGVEEGVAGWKSKHWCPQLQM